MAIELERRQAHDRELHRIELRRRTVEVRREQGVERRMLVNHAVD